MNPLFRELKKDETTFLKEMLFEAIFVEQGKPGLPKSIIDDPSLSKYIEDFGMRNGDRCVVAVVQGELVGACWGRLFSRENAGYGFVNEITPELSIAIHAPYRNRGIGAELMKRLIDYYRIQGVESVSLSVDKQNPAFRLYERMDFVIMNETEKSAVMKLDL